MKKRYYYALIGNILIALGVSVLNLSHCGLDPYTSMVKGVSDYTHIPLGVLQMSINLILYIPVLYFNRKAIGFGALVNLFLLGYFNQGFMSLWEALGINVTHLGLQMILLIVGLMIICFGVAMYMDTNLGVSPYDGVAPIIAQKTNEKIPFKYARILSDALCVTIGFVSGLMAHSTTVGVATVFVMFGTGPFVDFFSRKITQPLLQD